MSGASPRVLILAHGHPELSLGGGEIAAHAEWMELRRRGIEAMFVARSPHAAHPGTPFSQRSPDGLDVLFAPPPVDYFRHSQPFRPVIHEDFRALLQRFRPTIVHFHHYLHLGLELIRETRKTLPDAVILLTLHEFLLICHAEGQMLKRSGLLCKKARPSDCHACFPEIAPQDFFMRELFVKSFLSLVDQFICPSRFLCDRYIDWGLPAERMMVMENGQATLVPRSPPEPALRTRFVLLGQLSRLKGTLVLLDAVRLLPPGIRNLIQIEIHGSIQHSVEAFTAELAAAIKGLESHVRLCGPYPPDQVGRLIARNGWVIVPSIWWENSPMVIQEAFAGGRPVICSNVGGMAEKVEHGVSGLHFQVGSAADLASRIEEAATRPGLWESLCDGVPQPPVIADTVDGILDLAGRLDRAPMRATSTG